MQEVKKIKFAYLYHYFSYVINILTYCFNAIHLKVLLYNFIFYLLFLKIFLFILLIIERNQIINKENYIMSQKLQSIEKRRNVNKNLKLYSLLKT